MTASLDTQAWTRPGSYEEADGIHRIPLPMPNDGLRAVNVYAVLDGDDVVVVDAGWDSDEAHADLVAGLARVGVAPEAVREYVITHAHRDHYSLAVRMRERYGSRIAVGRGEGATLAEMIDGCGRSMRSQGPRLRRAGAPDLLGALDALGDDLPPQAYVAEPFEAPDRWLDHGDVVVVGSRTLRCVHTPGHTAGHTVLVDDATNAAFTGDHVLPHITPSAGFEAALTAQPLHDYLRSLEATVRAGDALLLPAHGPAGGSAAVRAAEILAHHEDRLAATSAACSARSTAAEVARRLPWTRHDKALHELDLFNQVLATVETLAHLDVLVTRGAAVEVADPGAAARFERA